MQFNTYLKSKLPFYIALSSLFVLASCGSYQYVGYDNDGIYTPTEEVIVTEESVTNSNDQTYYKGYFAEKSEKYKNIANDDNVVFTDIDNYEGSYNNVTGEVEYDEGYAGWGENSSNVVINVYDNGWYGNPWAFGYYSPWGWNNWGYSWYRPWGWNSWGWNSWGWNAGWGYGYNNWAWNSGFGWCAPYYGYGGYYGYHYGNTAYNNTRRGDYAYNQGRNSASRNNSRYNDGRNNSRYNDGRNTTRRNTNVRSANSSRYNPANSVRSNTRSTIYNGRSNSNTRSTTTRSNTRINRPTSTPSSNTRVNSPTRSSSSPSTTRSSSPTRSSSGGSGRSSGGSSSRRGG